MAAGGAAMRLCVLICAVVLGLTGTAAAQSASPHSDNMSLLANWTTADGDYQGSDMAFWGDRLVLGQYGGPGGFSVLDISDPAHPRPIGIFDCPGPQNDVSIWDHLVIVSV